MMSGDLIDVCLEATKRTYPSGYGFALAYLTNNPSPDLLRAMRDQALVASVRDTRAAGDDGWKFMKAYAESRNGSPHKGWPWFLIEAAQVVLADALAGNAKSGALLGRWGHPGY